MDYIFAPYLLPEEKLLWVGRPDPRVIFSRADIFLIPFSILWGWMPVASMLSSRPRASFDIFLLPFAIVGAYLIVGRFIYKWWVKVRTYYAVTDKRILVIMNGNLQAGYLDALPTVSLSRTGLGGVSSITFGGAGGFSAAYENTGLELLGSRRGVAFHDINDGPQVYALINEVKSGQRAEA